MVALTRSTFPQQIDSFVELYDLPPSLATKAKRYQELKMKPTLNATEQNELNTLTNELGDYIITPETWNKMADSIVNVETFFKDEVDGYITMKQHEWDSYIDDFSYIGVYDSNINYEIRNMVKFNGDLYICISRTQGNSPTNSNYWRAVSVKGDKGDVGLNTHLQGEYSGTATYSVGDAVTYNGNLFYCIKATTAGIAPTDGTYWYLHERLYVGSSEPSTTQKGLMWIEIQE